MLRTPSVQRFKDWFWIVPVSALILVAYLQARAVNALLRAAFLVGQETPRRLGAAPVPAPPTNSGDSILTRNPFDSATGPISDEPVVVDAPPPEVDPLRAPRCDGVRVVATAQHRDPLESVAVIQAANEARGAVRRVGDAVGGRRVAFIGRNPLEWGPAVWLFDAGGICQSLLFDQPAAPKPAVAAKVPPAPVPPRGATALPPDITKKIARTGPDTFRIERSAVEAILEQATKLLRSVRMRPAQENGKVVGFRLHNVASGTVLDVLGLKSGDEVRSVNGFELTGPAPALQAYAKLRTADRIRVKAVRGGKPLELEYQIQ